MASWPLWKFCWGAHFTQQFNYVEPFYRAQTPPSVQQCCNTRGFENISVLQTSHLLSELRCLFGLLPCPRSVNVQKEPEVGAQSSLLNSGISLSAPQWPAVPLLLYQLWVNSIIYLNVYWRAMESWNGLGWKRSWSSPRSTHTFHYPRLSSPAWPWAPPGMEQPQLVWAQPSQGECHPNIPPTLLLPLREGHSIQHLETEVCTDWGMAPPPQTQSLESLFPWEIGMVKLFRFFFFNK